MKRAEGQFAARLAVSVALLAACLGAAPASRPSPEQTRITRSVSTTSQTSAAPGLDAGRVVLALGIVLALIFALRWASRKVLPATGGKFGSGLVRIVGRTPIAPRQAILLVSVGRRLVMVGDSAGRLTNLGQITEADEVAEILGQARSGGETSAFPSLFGRAREEFETSETGETSELPAEAPPPNDFGGLMDKVRELSKRFGK